ncbi:hypothetical protein MA16_Dca008964 [Dendrobium catenatum]|uniref:Uncharacterized protein n=1 Tax=Dendrobium catenatum TaxID=906689 RepID=A0A2I0WRN4_9ASPA|nr:hypothetical protein MA16_Dca008964 [Dendrobium catenatum]
MTNIYVAVEESVFEKRGIESSEPEEFSRHRANWPCNPPPTRNNRKTKLPHILPLSMVHQIKKQFSHLEENEEKNSDHTVLLERKPAQLLLFSAGLKNMWQLCLPAIPHRRRVTRPITPLPENSSGSSNSMPRFSKTLSSTAT